MKKQKEKPVPLQAISLFERLSPRLFDVIDKRSGGKSAPVSFDVCKAVAQNTGLKTETYFLYALATWNRYKQIFEFDRDLAVTLSLNDALDDTLPVEILRNLPFPSMYIKLPTDFITLEKFSNSIESLEVNQGIDGFICTTYTENGTEILLFQMMFRSIEAINFGITLTENVTLKECICSLFKNSSEDVYKLINTFLQYVLYLCAENSDVQDKETALTVTEIPQTEKQNTPTKKQKPVNPNQKKVVKEWAVGFRYGQTIRKYKENSQEAEHHASIGKGNKKCPHARKGHFHHFWVGKRGEERRLILKWVSPVIVNGEFENLATIHKVK